MNRVGAYHKLEKNAHWKDKPYTYNTTPEKDPLIIIFIPVVNHHNSVPAPPGSTGLVSFTGARPNMLDMYASQSCASKVDGIVDHIIIVSLSTPICPSWSNTGAKCRNMASLSAVGTPYPPNSISISFMSNTPVPPLKSALGWNPFCGELVPLDIDAGADGGVAVARSYDPFVASIMLIPGG